MRILGLTAAIVILIACGGQTSDPGATSCTKSADCGAGKACGFPSASGCSAVGTCFPSPVAMCQAFSPGCSCSGQTINMICTGFPDGYVSAPLAYTGQCKDGG